MLGNEVRPFLRPISDLVFKESAMNFQREIIRLYFHQRVHLAMKIVIGLPIWDVVSIHIIFIFYF